MPPLREDPSRPVLRALIAAFTVPGAVHCGLAARVLDDARELLELRQRMPTLMFPRSAVAGVPDEPPVPPAAL
ncbi:MULTISPECIES: hypothetical protein [unclassified Rathayibacter]|uniref:hypothetical protein n=1 Tax=unclassified Rathayibacter TaxID=2609250 RepID=UPI0006F6BFDC|nr:MULTISPECIES: hypothetical protein [unclassified Rathayibacter]KQQ06169.1 hypothetical protein ASF42_06540 [Rathayibacter sp. Leaf294]KQS14026.1 hypothetical protein ASG06_06550 [Rathayibacter sp. Leaf185]